MSIMRHFALLPLWPLGFLFTPGFLVVESSVLSSNASSKGSDDSPNAASGTMFSLLIIVIVLRAPLLAVLPAAHRPLASERAKDNNVEAVADVDTLE